MNTSFIFRTVPSALFGRGKISQLAEVCKKLAVSKPLIVTDNGIVAAGLLEPLVQQLESQGLSAVCYEKVLPDPPEQNLHAAVALGKATGCDGVIGFGGGSSMDVAKVVAVLLESDQALADMYGVEQVNGKRKPLIQIPTTAGTGSEATAVAIFTTGESSKAGVVSSVLFADYTVLDPELTVGLPAHITAATGIDAMVHAIEAFTSKRLKNPMSDMVALKALDLLSANIETAVHHGKDIVARENMLLGAMLAGQAFANAPVGAVHALAYPLGGTFHIPHGLSNSLMLPHVLKFNAPSAAPLYAQIAKHLHGFNINDIDDVGNVGALLADYFYELAKRISLPTRLRDMNIQSESLAVLAGQAMEQERLLINNPREVSYEDALDLYQQAY